MDFGTIRLGQEVGGTAPDPRLRVAQQVQEDVGFRQGPEARQECHGPIDEKMDVAEQWAPLTMGWCIDCHNTKDVKMAGNGYYDEVMARLEETDMGHAELKQYLEDEKISVKELGGWECSKCHY